MDRSPLLQTDAYLVRPLARDDAGRLYATIDASRSEIGAWENWCNEGYGPAQAEAFANYCETSWAAGNEYAFGLFDRAEDELLAVASINQIRRLYELANVGYWVHSRYTGRGLATLLAGHVARFGMHKLGLQRIEIVAQVANIASQAVARKLGGTCECLARNRLRYRGEPRDAYVFSLIPADLAG